MTAALLHAYQTDRQRQVIRAATLLCATLREVTEIALRDVSASRRPGSLVLPVAVSAHRQVQAAIEVTAEVISVADPAVAAWPRGWTSSEPLRLRGEAGWTAQLLLATHAEHVLRDTLAKDGWTQSSWAVQVAGRAVEAIVDRLSVLEESRT
jgi:hypothetical protein